MGLNHRSQSALEYMMTYGWAILVIVIVAAVLYSLGIFSPSSSLSTTITGFSNLGTVNAVCLGGTSFTISMGDSTGYPINVTEINLTSSSGKTTYSPNILIQPNSIQTVTVPSSSLCTSGTRYSVSAVISYLEPGQIFPGPYTSTGTVAGTANSLPSSATLYEPLNITNTQNQGTPSPFQQMINVTSTSPGWGDISSSPFGQNIEFFSSTGQILDSWLENYTSTHAIWWVKLTSSISAGSKQTIYIGFAPTSTNLFNTNNIGEAPQIPCGSTPTSSCSNYAEYDDGANVFINYWNFAGTSLPNGWSGTYNSADNYTVSNGILLQSSSGGGMLQYQTNSYNPQTNILEGLGALETNGCMEFGAGELGNNGPCGGPDAIGIMTDTNSLEYDLRAGGGSEPSFGIPVGTKLYIMSLWENTTVLSGEIGYADLVTTSNQFVANPALYIGFNWGERTVADSMLYMQYVRTRVYPPNGVMPSVSFGSVS